jgi:hypothetical protein
MNNYNCDVHSFTYSTELLSNQTQLDCFVCMNIQTANYDYCSTECQNVNEFDDYPRLSIDICFQDSTSIDSYLKKNSNAYSIISPNKEIYYAQNLWSIETYVQIFNKQKKTPREA